MAYKLADALMAGSGITKAAGGAYTAQREAYARAWFPFADAMVTGTRELAARMDENLLRIRRMHEADQAQKAAQVQAFGMSVRGAEEPHQLVPLDPEQMRLRASLGPKTGPAYVNGHSNGHEYEEASDG